MREYELVVLYHPDIEIDIKSAVEKVAGIIEGAGGKIVATENWGRKKLAYEIKKQTHAVYDIYTLELPATAPKQVNDALNITTEVIRFLLSKVDPKIKALAEEAKKNKDEEKEEESKEEE